jgi:glycosyltransferase involved in cell wall biosynthesis
MCHQDTISKSFKYHDFDNVYHVIHTNLSEAKINRKTRWLSRLIAKVNLHLLYRNLKCISVSDGIRTDLQKSFKLENIKTIYNAVDVQQITTASQQSSHHPNGDYFIHVGNFTKAKRHDRLISAYQHSEIQTPLIMIGGESALSAAAARQIENLGLQKRALIHGFETNPYPWIANSKGLILASDFEGFGIVLAEAIALGVPIISTNCNSGPSEIVAGNSHCLADLTEESLSSKIRELDNDPDKFKVSLDKKFTLSCMVEEYYKLCE